MARVIKAEAMDDAGGPRAELLNLRDFATEAREVVLDARKEAARIVAEAREKSDAAAAEARQRGYDEGLSRGRHDGYTEGLTKGFAEGRGRADTSCRELCGAARQIVESLARARQQALQDAGGEVLDFALTLAAKIVGCVAARDVSAARANLSKALSLACGAAEITVRVNPEQLDQLRESCAEFVEVLGLSGKARLAGDESILPGGVKLTTGRGEIDATIETQLENVVAALLGEDVPEGEERDARGTYLPSGPPRQCGRDEAASATERCEGRCDG